MYPQDLKYTKEHMWIKPSQNKVIIGITHFAQESLGEIIFVDLPCAGDAFCAGDVICTVESAKSVSDVYTPLAGTIVKINDKLVGDPTIVNSDPYGDGWLVEMEYAGSLEEAELLTASDYERIIEN